jgi:hypothetical protein
MVVAFGHLTVFAPGTKTHPDDDGGQYSKDNPIDHIISVSVGPCSRALEHA